MKQDIINFTCPDFYYGFKVYDFIWQLQKEFPECFYENVNISSIFGNFPNTIWNGGACFFDKLVELPELTYYYKYFRELDIPIKLTFTNPCIEETDCYDRYCNTVARTFEDENNVVLVSSPILEQYIRQTYPKYKIHRSIIASEFDCDYQKELEIYDNIVLPRRLSKDMDFLNSIDEQYRSRLVILCTDACPVTCPRLYNHYKDLAQVTLYKEQYSAPCEIFPNNLKDMILRSQLYKEDQIMLEEINKDYLPLGYNNFKISGRGNIVNILFNVTRYIVKTEYMQYILKYFLNQLLSNNL